MMHFKGTVGAKLKKDFEKAIPDSPIVQKMKINDAAAIAKHGRMERIRLELDKEMKIRDENRMDFDKKGEKEIKEMENNLKYKIENTDKVIEKRIEPFVKEAKEMANHLARKHGLTEPNNPESLLHDRKHCYVCDMYLHIPNAYRNLPEDIQLLFGKDEDVRHLCCFCFAKMDRGEIVKLQQGEASKEIRLLIYNPEEAVREQKGGEIEKEVHAEIKRDQVMTKERKMYIEAKIKQYKGVVSLIGKMDHNLQREADWENQWVQRFSSRYDYANN